MTMTAGLRKAALTAHVVSSVGWLGAVAVFLALALVGLIGQDAQSIRADYLVMKSITLLVIVPLCLASVLTGIISSLGTTLGLFRHYWILLKFLMTIPATIVLFVHLRPISLASDIAAARPFSSGDLGLQTQLLVAAAAALVVLLVATTLSVYKPQGRTPYGWRKQQVRRSVSQV